MSLLIKHFYRFGEFTLDTDQRILLGDGKPLALTPKVFDTLLVLVENNGRIVSKEELMTRLWPDSFVEETNLTFNIKQLRKTLGDDARNPSYVETVARRGYRFIANVEEVLSERSPSSQSDERFETFDAQSPYVDSNTEVQRSGPAIQLAEEGRPAVAQRSPESVPATERVSTGVSKWFVALAAVLAIVLPGAALVLWSLSIGPDKNSGENNRVNRITPIASPLKLEKLTGTGQSRHVAISPDGKYLAYTRYFEKKSSVWLRQLATNSNIEIVPPTGDIYGLAFANSGEYLFFAKRVGPIGGPLLHLTALYRVPSVGGVATKVIERLEGNFSVSPDDSQIAFIRQAINREGQRQYALMVVNSDGTGERTLLVGAYPDELDVPVWTLDGQSIICSYGYSEGGGQDVRLIEVGLDDGVKKELSSERFFRIAKMAWSPDKSGLILSARKNLGDNNQLWRVSYPGMAISRITEELSSYLDLSIASGADRAAASNATLTSDIRVGPRGEPRNLKKITQAVGRICWTPNGRLVYTSTAGGNRDLWIMKPDGTEQRQLTVNAAVNVAPSVTPDSRHIVFISNRTGSNQIWRMDADGSNQIQLTDGPAKDHPAIAPDGKWVLFNTTDNWHLWKVSIEGGEPVRLTDYVSSRPSISPDGKMIACIGRTESKSELLILLFEGGHPLKRFDFAGWSSRLQWTADGRALIYAVERNGATALIKLALNGSPTEEIMRFDEDELFSFGFSYDGQFLAVTRGGWQHDVVLISDLPHH